MRGPCFARRGASIRYGDYRSASLRAGSEQLTYLLFLKMADERTKAPYYQKSPVSDKYNWPSLIKKDGDELFDHYRHILEGLGNVKGLLGLIFNKSQNKFDSDHPWSSAFGRAARAQIRSRRICQDPAKLRRLIVDLIDKENWSVMSADVKGDAYEGLLEKNAQDTKSGAGQYFTPRPLIQAIVDAMAPKPGETICDPACGTGDFLLAAHDYVVPDNVLFEDGAGETIRRKLLHECDVHTLLRLPTGRFYAQGVKANVLFLDKKPANETPWTKKQW